jgi:hypothetical protein
MTTGTNATKIQTALSNLYRAMSDAADTGVRSDPVFQPGVRAALRIYVDRLYAALETPLDGSAGTAAQLRFRTMAGAAAHHAETLLAWSEAKGGA